jgi:hypothetical protein
MTRLIQGAGTTDGPLTPMRTWDVRQRKEWEQRQAAPTPESATAEYWRRHEERWAAKNREEAERIQRQNEQIWAEQRAKQEAIQREAERQQRVKDFKLKERLIEGIFDEHGLTVAERARVNARLLAMGDIHNTDAAMIFAQEGVLSRGDRPPEQSNGVDWRQAVREKK